MRIIGIVVLLAASAFGQGTISGLWSASTSQTELNGNDQHQVCQKTDLTGFSQVCHSVTAKHVFLLEYMLRKKCPECSYRFLMICGELNPDCNTPGKDYTYFEWFETEKDALNDMEAYPDRKFVSLMKVQPLNVDVKESKVEVPVNPQFKTVKKYMLINGVSASPLLEYSVPQIASIEEVFEAGQDTPIRMTIIGKKPGAKSITADLRSTGCDYKKFSSYGFEWKDKDEVFPAWYEVDFHVPADSGDCHYELTNLLIDGQHQAGAGATVHVVPKH